jgi:hypothetical protein
VAIYSGRFVDGRVVIEGDPPPDGTEAEVYVIEEGEVRLTPDMENEIVEAIARLDRGEGIPAEQVLAELRRLEDGSPSP